MLEYADEDTFLWCLTKHNGPVVLFGKFKGNGQNALVKNVDPSYWPFRGATT